MYRFNLRDWISISIRNPFKTMKQLKGIFIPLKRYFLFGKNISYPFVYCPQLPKILLIRSCDVMWKDKWDTPRFEGPPYIWIYIFRFNFIWYWSSNDDDQYWEQALWYLYYYKNTSQGRLDTPNIEKAKESWPWEDMRTKQSSWDDNYLING